MKIKICGLRRQEDIAFVNAAMPDYAGFILAPSKRRISLQALQKLTAQLDEKIRRVGVFVNAPHEEILAAAEFLDVLQLHGDEDADFILELRRHTNQEIWKAVRARTADEITAAERLLSDKLLIDGFSPAAYGGTGTRANLDTRTAEKIRKPFFIAGGITAENMAEIVRQVNPYGVDISSGAETDGYKDRTKIDEIMRVFREIRSADRKE